MYQLDNKAIHKAILKRLNEIKKPTRYLDSKNKKVICRATLNRLNTGKPILMITYFKIVDWLDVEPLKFIKKIKQI